MATITKVVITLRVMIAVQNHAERDNYCLAPRLGF